MVTLRIAPISDDLPYGARVNGVDAGNASDPGIREEMNRLFYDRGIIIFENVEPSNQTQASLSEMFGPLQAHDVGVSLPEGPNVKGLLDSENDGVAEVDGAELENFLPWHFDQCYAPTLTRGGVLRALSIAPEGGQTSFADGIQLYTAISSEFRERFERLNILHDSALLFWNMKFGRPKSYRSTRISKVVAEQAATTSKIRAVHPAIWRRPSGEGVVHISPMQAAGIEGMETAEGDFLLEAMCQEIYSRMVPYHHHWKATDMVIWDNCRFIHAVIGHSPSHVRNMRRTVVFGDYGLGRRER